MHLLAAVLLAASVAQATPRPPAPSKAPPATDPANQTPPPRGAIPGLVAEGNRPVQIASGFRFTEGPAADASGQIYFVDVITSRILKVTSMELDASKARENTTDFVVNDGHCYGLMFGRDGRLFAAQGDSPGTGTLGGVCEIDLASKKITPLLSAPEIDGAPTPVTRANDLAVDAEGGIYFTDPSLGRIPSKSKGILYRSPTGASSRVDTTIAAPNGVRLSADGKHLFALSFDDPGVYRFEVLAPGRLGPAEKFASLVGKSGLSPGGRGDGLAIDEKGNLWCANPDTSEIQVVSPEGVVLGRVPVLESPSNCAFGGADGTTLFITARTSLYGLRTEVAGTWIARSAKAAATPTTKPATNPTTSPASAPKPAGR